MAKSRKQKEAQVASLKKKLEEQKAAVFAGYQGLTVPEFQELRARLREEGGQFNVVKNSLFALAAKEAGLEQEVPDLAEAGPMAMATCVEEETAAARVLYKFAKEHDALKIEAGLLENKALTKEEVEALAKLPSREELIAKTVGTIAAPLSSFVGVLAANLRNVVGVFAAIRDQKESAS